MSQTLKNVNPMIQTRSKRIDELCRRPMALYGAATLRIGYGIAGTAYYVRNYEDRHFLWGPNGVFPFETFQRDVVPPGMSLYQFTQNSMFAFELFFHLGIVISILFCIGFGGRVTTVAHYIFLISLFLRNPALLDGGDNLAYLVLLYLIPVNATAVLAVKPKRRPLHDARISTVLHNMGIILIAMQLFVVYWASSLYKVQGKLWQDGTALYYILRIPEFSWPIITDHLTRHAWIIVITTYFAVLFQLMFPLLIAVRETRVAALFLAALFHIGIAVLMGLTSFSVYMIATEAIFLSDLHYRRVGVRLDRWIEQRLGRPTRFAQRSLCRDPQGHRPGLALKRSEKANYEEERP